MCLYLTDETKKEYIAQEPIVCYKILRKLPLYGYITPFKRDEIKLGKVYRAKGDRKVRPISWVYGVHYKYFVNEGFIHTFCTLEGAQKALYHGNEYGLNAFDCIIVKCTIPTGAKYYKGVFEQTLIPCYASTSVRYWKKILHNLG